MKATKRFQKKKRRNSEKENGYCDWKEEGGLTLTKNTLDLVNRKGNEQPEEPLGTEGRQNCFSRTAGEKESTKRA